MNRDILSRNFFLSDVEKARLELFWDYIWTNSELCCNCFTKVRDIGPEISRPADSQTYYLNLWYERTEQGSQEYAPGDENKRYGQCYCRSCGWDLTANHRNKSLEDLIELAHGICVYTNSDTPISVDRRTFARVVGRLKQHRNKQGCETEILAVGFARSITNRP